MAKATASDDKQFLSTLEELVTFLRDAEQGYRRSAEDVRDDDLRSRFQNLSRERGRDADEVTQLIQSHGGTPPSREGTTSGSAYRMWMDVKSAVTGGDRQSILKEVYRSECFLEECYDRALKGDLQGMTMPTDIVQVLQQQHVKAREARNQSRSMLESMGVHPAASGGGMMSSISHGVGDYVVERPVMGTALAFGTGMLIGVLLAMTMRSGGSSYGGRQGSYGSSADYTRYGGRSGYSGAQGYGYGATSQTSQTRYGDEGQAAWR